ncbi:MAG: undecaprenyl-diphosphate phosphatase [Eggerthellaceae bacterium]|jgi:undecaprenyl-diphosphatase|nr:undecaprenyl-diphosphate phosphatase [Eggerthellaceae bacterium]MDR2721844.1 undecaprenyl-diphosphate phosphatase [Coriobacteriaceae bacterium]
MFFEALKALVIGIVEGITEWLPVSSTGHMILVDEFIKLQVSPEFLELFLVVIQLGAIMAVLILYFNKLNPFSAKKTAPEKKSTWRLWGMVVIGCIPAAVIGLAFDDWVHDNFYGAITVSIALIFYGIVFIVIEMYHKKKHGTATGGTAQASAQGQASVRGKHARTNGDTARNARISNAHNTAVNVTADGSTITTTGYKINTVDAINVKTALIIGAFQTLAIIPGTSRSGSTIIGGLLTGCSRVAAAEFSFFLAIPVMFGWGLLKTVKYLLNIGLSMTSTEVVVLLIGIVTAFILSVVSIKFLIGFVQKHSFIPFGIYRIVVGVIVLGYFALSGGLI